MGNVLFPEKEEIIIMSSVEEMAKLVLRETRETMLIWHDPKVDSPQNLRIFQEFVKFDPGVKKFSNWQDAVAFLKSDEIPFCQVITSGTNGLDLVKEIHQIERIISIHVYCENVEFHKTWADSWKVASVDKLLNELLKHINKSLDSWRMRTDLPAYAPIFDDVHKSENNTLHYYLKGFVGFKNREKSKRDFIALAKTIYGGGKNVPLSAKNFGEYKHIQEFEKDYNEYTMEKVFKWYTKECFFYKIANNCLRVATADAILFCRLVLRDLEIAIKQKYQMNSRNFYGLLFRGTYISENEWAQLNQNIGKEIEMYGFLSTTKREIVAKGFLAKDTAKKALVTIIIPDTPDKGEQGFAEIKEYSVIPDEDEVLFNVRSRFTILGTTTKQLGGKDCRHLLLLYGAQAMRKFMTEYKPTISISFETNVLPKCHICKSEIQRETLKMFVNLEKRDEYVCRSCLNEYKRTRNSPLLYIPPSIQSSLEIKGFVVPNKNGLLIPFHGYGQCKQCQQGYFINCYKCLTCQGEERKIYCEQCFNQDNPCIIKEHMLILESYGFSFWSEEMSDKELYAIKYHDKKLENMSRLFQQAQVFLQTHNFEKAAQFYLKFLDQNKEYHGMDVAVSYDDLGTVYSKTGEYDKAIEFCTKALQTKKAILGDKHPDTSNSYNTLASAYSRLGQHEKAIEFYWKALENRKAIFGSDHPDVAISYNNLGAAYSRDGKYEQAIELYEKAYEIQQKTTEELNVNTAAFLNNLATAYLKLEKYAVAMEKSTKALEIQKEVLGGIHSHTATSYNNIATIYAKQEQYQEAMQNYSKALEIQQKVLGDHHPSTIKTRNNLESINQKIQSRKI